MATVQEEIARVITHSDKEWSAADIATKLGYDSSTQISTPLRVLVEEGVVKRVRRGVYRASRPQVIRRKPQAVTDNKGNGVHPVAEVTVIARRDDTFLLLDDAGVLYRAEQLDW